jgi:cytoskeletal protein RodZ
MEPPGKYLKTERESRNLTLEKVSDSTKIRRHLLQAIEEDRYELLPPPVYVKGFLATYATFLGLNPNEIIHQYQEHIRNLTLSKMEEPKKRIPLRKRIKLKLLIIPFAILFATILVYHISSVRRFLHPSGKEHRPVSSVPSIPKEAETQKADRSEEKQASTQTSGAALQEEPLLFEVVEFDVGTGIDRKNNLLAITGKSSEFVCSNQKVYCMTRIKTNRKGKIVHKWLWQDNEFHRKEIEIKPPQFAVYSLITLKPHHGGNWRVEISREDKVLRSVSFTAVEPPFQPGSKKQ